MDMDGLEQVKRALEISLIVKSSKPRWRIVLQTFEQVRVMLKFASSRELRIVYLGFRVGPYWGEVWYLMELIRFISCELG